MGKKNKSKQRDADDDWENEIETLAAELDGRAQNPADAEGAAAAAPAAKAEAATPKPTETPADAGDASADESGDDAAGDQAATTESSGRMLTKSEKEKLKKEKEKAKKAAKKARQKEQKKAEDEGGADGAEGEADTASAPAAAAASKEEAPADDDGSDDDDEGDEGGEGGAEGGADVLTKAQKKKLRQKEKKKADAAAAKGKGGDGKPKKQTALGKQLKARLEAEEKARKELAAENDELQRQADEEQAKLDEEFRLEQEKKDEKKRKEKEKKERLRSEGKLLTKKQKAAEEKRKSMRRQLEAAGKLPTQTSKSAQKKPQKQTEKKPAQTTPTETDPVDDSGAADKSEAKDDTGSDDGKEDWELSDDEDDEPTKDDASAKPAAPTAGDVKPTATKSKGVKGKPASTVAPPASAAAPPVEETDGAAEERKRSAYDDYGGVEKGKLRSPICVVMGHVDTGKTKILDKIRNTTVQDGEAGGITQQIGASFFPMKEVSKQMSAVSAARKFEPLVPGLLIMDTPGHESFSNLRDRGSSLCNIAVLVIDIMHGLEPQTIESINLLKKKKCPFIIALNKVDRVDGWKPTPNGAIQNSLKKQKEHTQQQFEILSQRAILGMNELGFNCAMYWENPDPRTYLSIVPTSAHTGEGIPDLLFWVVKLTQTVRAAAITYTGDLNCTVLEVKKIDGYGTTIDVILADGVLHEGDRVVLAGLDGPICTTIRSLLMPEPLKELRVKNAYRIFKSVPAANGVKIAAKDLDKAIAGLKLEVARDDEHEAELAEQMAGELDKALKGMRTVEKGVHVQASTLGSLEALLSFLRESKVPVSGLSIGPVHKKDVTRCSIQLEKDKRLALILAFDVVVEREAQHEADRLGIKIFTAEIIYHLFESFKKHQQEEKERLQREFASLATFPCRLEMIPDCVFNTRDPIVVGVKVTAGQLKIGTPLVARTVEKGLVHIGVVGSMELEHNEVPLAKTGQEVCIKIVAVGDKKLLGRHFEVTDELISKISRESIDAVKMYFKDDMGKADWKLFLELKKIYEII
eukprot:m.234369 g.234369  ORF g.234369 m.234369 type:complete len:1034 (-) comp26125_c0_seq1:104-3205(-)